MKLKAFFLTAFLLWSVAILPAQKAVTLDDCFTFFKFYPQNGGDFQYLNDGRHFVVADGDGLHIRDVLRPDKDSLVALQLTEAVKDYDLFDFNSDETRLLLRTATEPVYRHSVLANYYVYNLENKVLQSLYEPAKQQYVTFSPDGAQIAFVAENNLYFKNLNSGKITQITSDGADGQIINGLPDWVYEEEFSPVDGQGMVAARWSPDGSMIAFLRFDETQVSSIPLTWYEGGMYPRHSSFKYPKVGERNSEVSAHVYHLRTGQTTRIETGAETDMYLPRIQWTPDNRVVVTRLNRGQSELDLILYEPASGAVSNLLHESDPAYVELETENKLVFLEKSPYFLWTSERSGYNHLWKYPLNMAAAAAPVDLTPGNFEVTAFYGFDATNGKFYYQTATPTPMDRQVWEGSIDGAAPRLLTPKKGVNDAQFCPTFDYFTHSWSDANTPPVVSLNERSGAALRTLTDNQRVRKLRQEYGFVNKEFFSFRLADGTELNGWMIKPPKMDPAGKYPVLIDIYGGPGAQTVQNQYDGYMGSWHQMLAQKGYIIASIDNRGTGGRGRDFKKITQLQLGKLETEDQIAAARYLGALPYVDPARIGIWGWSFGGYLSTSCILKGADVFKMAMAVAPVTNWKWYDSAYTERYMRTTTENPDGYENNSPVNFADRLKGDNYLICHGIDDDNVHWQQTVEMINALIGVNKQFETYYYPNRNHGIYGDNATRHLFTKLTDFLQQKL